MHRGGRHAALVLALALTLILSIFAVGPPQGAAHSPSGYIYSRWDSHAPIIDGEFNLTEWENSSLVDLRLLGSNTLDAYLYAKNNDTHLFIALDAVGDTTEDTADYASISFDGDHDGAPTNNGDHEFSIRGEIDTSCTSFTTTKCHFVYSQTTNRWWASDDMDQSRPYQFGLNATIGFGNSSKSPTEPHRIYEFSIPIEMIGRPLMPISIGDTVGFYVGRHPLPTSGIRDYSGVRFAYWPDGGLDPSEYGNLVLGTPADVALNPEFATKPVRPGETVQYTLKVRSTGNETDSFDLQASSLQGWTVKLLDAFGDPLSDHPGGNPAYPDVGPIMPGDYVNVIVEVTASASATPGIFDLTEVRAYPFRDSLRWANATLRTGIPYTAPFVDSLELGTEAWYVFPRPVNDWEVGTPTFSLGPPGAHTGANAFATKLDSNYSVCSNSILYAPFMEIPDWVLGAKLTFWHWYDIAPQDGGWIEMSVDGQPWVLATPVGGYPNTKWGGGPAYAGTSGDWLQAEVNLSLYVGSIVSFRFRFWDYGELVGPIPLPDKRAPGWYLDDLELSIVGLPAAVEIKPKYQYLAGLRSTQVSYELFIKNVGQQSDTFDVMITNSTLDWDVEFYDSAWNLLPDTESPPDGYPDTNRITPGSEVLVRMDVTIPSGATPGGIDEKVFTARSSNDETVYDSVIVETQVPFTLPFFDDMEAGPDLWKATSYWHLVYNETLGAVWNLSYSGEYAWWYGQDVTGDYDDGFRNYGNLTSPPIDLTDSIAAELTFRYWYETEYSMDHDQRWLIIRTGNNPWPEKGQSGTIQLDLRQNRTWLEWKTNLSTYGGKIIQIRLFFDTVDNLDNDYQGWYIDDFSVNQTIAKNTPPTVTVESPGGGESWSGESNHTIAWTALDSTDSPADMLAWINYSVSGGEPWLPIPGGQGVPADSAPLNWTLPLVNSSTVVINATLVDSGGLWSYDWSEKFQIDSKPPQVSFFSPQGNDVRSTASIVVMFDEMMNESSLVPSFSFVRTDTWEDVTGDLFTTNESIFFDPLYNLEYGIEYMVSISTVAKDASSPGNPLAQMFSWAFNTTTTLNEPPTIAIISPFGGESWSGGSNQQISWIASDPEDPTEVLDVCLNYSSSPDGPWVPISGAQGIRADGTPMNWSVPLVNMSAVLINATVVDSRGAWNFTHSEMFEIDSARPTITAYSPRGPDPVPVTAQITVTFSESMAEYSAELAFRLSRWETGSEVLGTFGWQGNTMIFTPSSLSAGTWYKVEIDESPRDDSVPGNSLSQNLSWMFQTETGDITPPTVVETIPEINQVDVPVGLRNITITFNESMNKFSVINALNITPQVSFSTSWSNESLIILLNEPLQYDTWYTIRINGSAARDYNNNLLDGNSDGSPGGDFIFYFSTEKEPVVEEVLDILPYLIGMLLAMIIVLLALYFLKGKTEPRKEEEGEEEEEVDVEKELKDIDELLGIEEED